MIRKSAEDAEASQAPPAEAPSAPPQAQDESQPPAPPAVAPEGRTTLERRVLVMLLVLAILAALYVTQAIAIPTAAALLVSLLFKPVVRRMYAFYIGPALAATLIVAGLCVVTVAGIYVLSGPVAAWVDDAPRHLAELEQRLLPFKRSMAEVAEATQRIEEATAVGEDGRTPTVEVQPRSFASTVLNQTGATLVGLGLMLVLTFFLLATDDLFLRKLVHVLPRLSQKKDAVDAARQLERDVSHYLVTVTLINTGLGMVLWVGLSLTGLSSAWMWALVGAVFNFVPYVGPIAAFVLLAVASLLQFETLGQAAIPPAVFAVTTALEGYVITPSIMGRRLRLNPVMILLSLMFWGWMWGVAGALLAVPLLVCFKIVCDHVPPLQAVGEFLEGE